MQASLTSASIDPAPWSGAREASRRQRTALALVAALSCAATAAHAQPAPPVPESRIDALFSAWTAATPGCAVGVSTNGRIVLQKAYGLADLEHGVPNTPDTIFEAGSVSKQFTAAAILLLARDGKLSLDDSVRRYLPEVPDHGAAITLRQMLQHTSGLRDWGSIADVAGWPRTSRVYTHAHVLDILGRQSELNFAPGTRWSYSNSGYNLAAIVVARVSGESFADFTRRRIFEPLGMTRTSWRDDFTRVVRGRAVAYAESGGEYRADMPFENIHGNGGLLTTVGDLLRWNENFVEPRVGDADFAREMQTPGRLDDGREFDYAFGLSTGPYQGLREVRHSGTTASYRAYLARYPDPHVSVAVLCNAGNSTPRQTAHAVADLYLAGWLKPEPAPIAASVPASDLDVLAGLYRNTGRGDAVTIGRDGSTLRIGDETPFIAIAPRRFANGEGTVIEFGDHGAARIDWGGGTFVDIARVEAVNPTVAELETLAGAYVSSDAETTLTVSMRDGFLEIARRPDSRFRLSPRYADAFDSDLGTIIFRRDGEGRPVEFSVVRERVWDLRFRRQPDGDRAEADRPDAATSELRDGQRDFDFEFGTWKTHLKRLLRPLTGSTTRVEYEGTTTATKVWGGRANRVELVVDGPTGHFEGLSLRLYNPETRQWSLNFSGLGSGAMSPPAVGRFKDGRGEFYNEETLNIAVDTRIGT